MGREIRYVPADWQHPRYTDETASRSSQVGQFIPLYDEDYDTAAEKWLANVDLWRKGEHPDQKSGDRSKYKYFWDWDGGAPDKNSYRERKWTPEEATHCIMYETVSEGTPVTPSFATKAELVEYLVANGTFWDKGNGWPRDAAEKFVEHEWAPSMILSSAGVKSVNESGFYK